MSLYNNSDTKKPSKKHYVNSVGHRKDSSKFIEYFQAIRSSKISSSFILFWKKHWIGTILIILATLVFFWPLVIRVGTYSEGGDAMFNSWAVARNQHCILQQDCPKYANGNIFFPHTNTMLYSESELSSGLVTLPLYLINHNPLFSNNVLTILSFFLSGWFMYILAKYLSRGRKGSEFYSVMAGLVFEFAPIKLAGIWHLQNQSIFYLPLAVLLILKFIEIQKKRYLLLLFTVLALQFYASWYQMVFVLIVCLLLIVCMTILKQVNWKSAILLSAIVALAAASTLPLAIQYTHFSKESHATFGLAEQVSYSASLMDYAKPYYGTILGRIYYHVKPTAQTNSYNPDSDSYHGFILYITAFFVIIMAYLRRHKSKADYYFFAISTSFVVIAIVGFLMSLGPLLKVRHTYLYPGFSNDFLVTISLPYILVDKFIPQLGFLRAIGRASIILLFALCVFLALTPKYIDILKPRIRYIIMAITLIFIVVEILPDHRVTMSVNSYSYNLQIPNVYKFVKRNKDINNILVLQADKDYPKAPFPVSGPEAMLWAGYTNRNIFNGYSSYQPPEYASQYADFVDFQPDDIAKMKELRLHYILLDRQLSSTDNQLEAKINNSLSNAEVFRDGRYTLFRIN